MTGLMALGLGAQAALHEFNYDGANSVNLTIPDGNPGGVANTLTVSGLGMDDTILDVNVYLNISGGYNGDLYGYLVAPNGSYAVLLNRIGRDNTFAFGNNGVGIVVNLDDDAAANIHTAAFGSVSGLYAPDGRTTNPASVVTTDSVTQTLSDIGGPGNGTWTIFFADLSGGETSTLVSWGLQIEAVPEPTTLALVTFGAMGGLAALVRAGQRRRARKD
jgi:subtilisin-like proprotein convertase family protein